MSRPQGYRFASEQELGTDPTLSLQQDRVRIENLRTASGARLLLGVIADGNGGDGAGHAAEQVILQLFETVQKSREADILSVLIDGLTQANEAVMKGYRVAVTVVAIKNGRIFLAHAGTTSAYVIREGNVTSLTRTNRELLGDSHPPQITTNSSKGEVLHSGDSIVLCSDGLTQINPEDGKCFVDPGEFPSLISDNTPREAARHIISIAMGRDVTDNVSVIVIQAPQKREGGKRLWVFAVAFMILGMIIALLILTSRQNGTDVTIEPVDYGYAVVLSGSVFAETSESGRKTVEKLGTVPPSSEVEALDRTRLTLQSNQESSTDVTLISIYLSSGSKVQIRSVDAMQDVDGTGSRFQRIPTKLAYLDGAVLVLRSGGGRRLQVEAGDVHGSMPGVGRAIIGVRTFEEMIQVDCIQGSCAYELAGGEITQLQAGQSLTIAQNSDEPIGANAMDFEDLAFWDDLCGGCLTGP